MDFLGLFGKKNKSCRRLIILNPASSSGRAVQHFKTIYDDVRQSIGEFDLYLTRGPGDARNRISRALQSNECDQILVAGGDGTINEAVNGYFQKGKILSKKIPLGVINLGTGGDFWRTLKMLSESYFAAVRENRFQLVDCGVVYPAGNPGAGSTGSGILHAVAYDAGNYFINITSAGIGGDVVRSLKTSGFNRGSSAFYFHTVKTLLAYKAPDVTIRMRNSSSAPWREISGRLINLFIANARYNGGGMMWAPHAELDDGLFDIVFLNDTNKFRLVASSNRVYKGELESIQGLNKERAAEILLSAASPLSIEVDGELPDFPDRQNFYFKNINKVFPLIY